MAIQSTSADPPTKQATLSADWEVEVFYDGECPLCKREMRFFRWLDRGRGKIRFTDITAADFEPQHYGLTMQAMMDEIHGRLPDGRLIVGIEVFRRLYAAVGLSWLAAITRLPGVRQGLDVGYQLFAKNRLRLTGRCAPDGACRVK